MNLRSENCVGKYSSFLAALFYSIFGDSTRQNQRTCWRLIAHQDHNLNWHASYAADNHTDEIRYRRLGKVKNWFYCQIQVERCCFRFLKTVRFWNFWNSRKSVTLKYFFSKTCLGKRKNCIVQIQKSTENFIEQFEKTMNALCKRTINILIMISFHFNFFVARLSFN